MEQAAWPPRPSTAVCPRLRLLPLRPYRRPGQLEPSPVRPPAQRSPIRGPRARPRRVRQIPLHRRALDPDHAAHAVLLGLNGLRVSEACGTNIEDLGFDRGHRTLRIIGKGNKPAVIPWCPGRPGPSTSPSVSDATGRSCDATTASDSIGALPPMGPLHRQAGRISTSTPTCSAPRSSWQHSMQAYPCGTSRSPPGRRPRPPPSMTDGGTTSTATPPMSWWLLLPAVRRLEERSCHNTAGWLHAGVRGAHEASVNIAIAQTLQTHSARVLLPDGRRVGVGTWCPHDTTAISDENRPGSGLEIAKITRLDVLPAVVGNHPGPAEPRLAPVITKSLECPVLDVPAHGLLLRLHDMNTNELPRTSPPTRRSGAASTCRAVPVED